MVKRAIAKAKGVATTAAKRVTLKEATIIGRAPTYLAPEVGAQVVPVKKVANETPSLKKVVNPRAVMK